MQQLPPFPDNDPAPIEPSQPGGPSEAPNGPSEAPAGPSEAPAEAPGGNPNIDVPSPSTPGTEAPTTPISPVG